MSRGGQIDREQPEVIKAATQSVSLKTHVHVLIPILNQAYSKTTKSTFDLELELFIN